MTSYVMKDANPDDFDTIYATHPALPDTYIGYALDDGTLHRVPVVLWAVLSNGSPEPISMDGVWGGTSQDNNFVIFPDGHCARYEQCWDTIEEAIAALRKKSA
ncbi:hypothetical protein EEB18_013000 [Sphingopyxis sp. OPL5]|jgi:hypothetical protein|uniref:hypothetical protein n=1 Tax=Sphingopyxis sp. OPL5 TaxID=2486273 RepID=UPI00164DBBC9|nr:hypothetical protein [Sphingopyxis sp. OPL5]QNO25711.1 hypothetical protein EEB18_013000 [Sphingopyxis sp. OPL5]